MGPFYSAVALFPNEIANDILDTAKQYAIVPEEIRVRCGQAVCLRCARTEYLCHRTKVSAQDMEHIIVTATHGSFHCANEYMQMGFLPLEEGCRMGISGEGVLGNGTIRTVRNISSICIRIPMQVYGCADNLLTQIANPAFESTIIISPPGLGKTTLLRELIRSLSEIGYYVGVSDERGEISGMNDRKPYFDLGPRCDVACGMPKQVSSMMLLKTMSPDILAMDEITAIQDMPAIIQAIGCGVKLLTTVHGNSICDLKRPAFEPIWNLRVFKYAILITLEHGKRQYTLEKLYD